jgi:hypothetical protein
MKPSITAALVSLCLVPSVALAEVAEGPSAAPPSVAAAPAPAAAEPTGPWSLGAGLGYVVYGSPVFAASYPGYTNLPYAPTVRASLERAVAPRWWLVAGASGFASRTRSDVQAGYTYPPTRSDATSLSISGGVRRALHAPGAPVTVSGLLLAQVGWTTARSDRAGAVPEVQRGEALGVGLSAGLAVDRELLTGLSLRVATPVLAAMWTSQRLSSDVSGVARTKGGEVSLTLAPSLELRLDF